MIYVIGGFKGGTGKSTIATNLAVLLGLSGQDTLLIDTDETETSTDFSELRPDDLKQHYTCIQLHDKAVRSQLVKLKDKYDQIVIDCGARDTIAQRAALTIADVYIVPMAPRSFDLWPMQKVADTIDEVKALNPELQCFSIVNKADASGQDNEEAARLLLEYEQLRYIPAQIGNRKAFNTAQTQGLSVLELQGVQANAKAATEVLNMFTMLCSATNQMKVHDKLLEYIHQKLKSTEKAIQKG